MARYGSGYFTDMESLVIGIDEGLKKAFIMTCEQLVEGIKDWCDVDIYSKEESDRYTPRTGEFRESWDYDIITVSKGLQEAQFVVRESAFKTVDNPFHNVIEQGGLGDDMRQVVFAQNKDLKDDIELWIRDNFEKKYRANCMALGIALEN